jgi:hypothetical protein
MLARSAVPSRTGTSQVLARARGDGRDSMATTVRRRAAIGAPMGKRLRITAGDPRPAPALPLRIIADLAPRRVSAISLRTTALRHPLTRHRADKAILLRDSTPRRAETLPLSAPSQLRALSQLRAPAEIRALSPLRALFQLRAPAEVRALSQLRALSRLRAPAEVRALSQLRAPAEVRALQEDTPASVAGMAAVADMAVAAAGDNS